MDGEITSYISLNYVTVNGNTMIMMMMIMIKKMSNIASLQTFAFLLTATILGDVLSPHPLSLSTYD